MDQRVIIDVSTNGQGQELLGTYVRRDPRLERGKSEWRRRTD